MGELVSFRRTSDGDEAANRHSDANGTIAYTTLSARSAASDPLTVEQLYPSGSPAAISRPLQLLNQVALNVHQAILAYHERDALTSDDLMQVTQPILDEIFTYRAELEGLAATTNAIQCALLGMNGLPLSLQEMEAIRNVANALKMEPFLSLDRASVLIEELEQAGLNTIPPGLDEITDLIDG